MRIWGLPLAFLLGACGPKLMHGVAPAPPSLVKEPELVAAPEPKSLREQAVISRTSLEFELDEGYFRARSVIYFELRDDADTLFLYGDGGSLRGASLVSASDGKEQRIEALATDREGLYAFKIARSHAAGGTPQLMLELRLEGALDDERAPLVRVRDGGSEYWIPARDRPFLRPLFLDVDHLGGAERVEVSAWVDDRLHIVGSRPIRSRAPEPDKRDEKDRIIFEPAFGIMAREYVIAVGPFDKIARNLKSGGEEISAELFATRGRGVQLGPTADELSRAIRAIEAYRREPIGRGELRLLVSPFFQTIPYGLLVLDEESGLAHSQRGKDRADLFSITRAITELILRDDFVPRSDADELLLSAMAYREALDALDVAAPGERMSEFFARSVERRKRFADLGGGLDEFRLISLIEAIAEERGEDGYRALFEDDRPSASSAPRTPISVVRLMEQLGEAAPALHGLARVVFERRCSGEAAAIEASVLSGPKARICIAIGAGDKEERRCFTLDPEDALPETIALPGCDAPFTANLEGFGFYRSRLSKAMITDYLAGRFESASFAERAAFYHDAIDAAEYGAIDPAAFESVLERYARSSDPLIARLPLQDLGRLLDEVSDPGERAWVASLLERFYLERFTELSFERGGGEFNETLRAAIGEQLFRAPRDEALKKELLIRAKSFLGLGARVDHLALAPGLIAPALAFAMGELGEEAIEAVVARFRQAVTNKEREALFQAFLHVEQPLAATKVRELALEPVLAKESVLAILRDQLRRASSRRDTLAFIRAESEMLTLKLGERADFSLALLAGELCEDVELARSALPLDEAREAGFAREIEFALARAVACKERMRHLREVNAELARR